MFPENGVVASAVSLYTRRHPDAAPECLQTEAAHGHGAVDGRLRDGARVAAAVGGRRVSRHAAPPGGLPHDGALHALRLVPGGAAGVLLEGLVVLVCVSRTDASIGCQVASLHST